MAMYSRVKVCYNYDIPTRTEDSMRPIDRILEVYAERLKELTALARSIVSNSAEAEDVLQDVIVKLLSDHSRTENVRNEYAFLRTCVRNEAVDHVRSVGREAPTDDELLGRFRSTASEEEYREIEDLMWVRGYVRSLPEDMQRAFIAHVVDGRSIAELARETGIKPDTLRKRFDLVKKRMRSDVILHTLIFLSLS